MDGSERDLKVVTGVGRLRTCLTVTDQLWIAATDLPQVPNAPTRPGEGGLFRWKRAFAEPERVIQRDVHGLSRNGERAVGRGQ